MTIYELVYDSLTDNYLVIRKPEDSDKWLVFASGLDEELAVALVEEMSLHG